MATQQSVSLFYLTLSLSVPLPFSKAVLLLLNHNIQYLYMGLPPPFIFCLHLYLLKYSQSLYWHFLTHLMVRWNSSSSIPQERFMGTEFPILKMFLLAFILEGDHGWLYYPWFTLLVTEFLKTVVLLLPCLIFYFFEKFDTCLKSSILFSWKCTLGVWEKL